MKRFTITLALALGMVGLFSGCTSMVKFAPYPSAAAWTPDVKPLGTVSADSGRWPLSLHSQPSDYTYYSALRAKAAQTYGVPEPEIVLGEVSVQIGAELDGTIRDWKASAAAGWKKVGVPATSAPAQSAVDKMVALKKLLDAGVITQSEFDAKKKALLENL
jgi:hypothetical protein